MQRPGRFWREYAGYGGVVQGDLSSYDTIGRRIADELERIRIVGARRPYSTPRKSCWRASSPIEGARKIVASMRTARIGERDSDLIPFIGIVSATDALLSEQTKRFWQAAALEDLRPEMERAEAWERQFAESRYRNLVAGFSRGQIRIEPPLDFGTN
jgi:hypothetical protein